MVLFSEKDIERLQANAAEEGSSAATIKEGDLVIVYEGFNNLRYMTVNVKNQFSNRYGNFPMKRWIGQPWGTKVFDAKTNSKFVYLLRPSPELWTQVLNHRTQILYIADIAMVCSMLDLKPGSIVLESGTGSGSLTHSLARAVAPHGHVHTFEFHQVRAETADLEFKANGLGDLVTVRQRNIEEQGFIEELHGQADAVFLDLPGPYKVVPSAARCLKEDGVLCCFSPCIEQVQRSCEAMVRNGFHDLKTIEVLLREYESNLDTQLTSLDAIVNGVKKEKGGKDNKNNKRKREEDTATATEGAEVVEGAAVSVEPATARTMTVKPRNEARGHTGYLTFARLGVRVPPEAQAAWAEQQAKEHELLNGGTNAQTEDADE